MIPIPSAGQLAWQRAGFGVFCHFGVNTFHDTEWSDGSLPPWTFTPDRLDADQWAETAAAAGARYLVLTAKHHDGFCLWPTATTRYSVASAPWRGGAGDVVGEVARACERAGLKLGLYLSPWDRNASCYDHLPAYDDFYRRQLTELCTRYGELFELWFDAAGSQGRNYAWDTFMKVIDTHQPQAMVFNLGRPTIRWVGNEDGLAQDPCDYAVRSRALSLYHHREEDLDETAYLPPECDVPLRDNWFWRTDDEHTIKTEAQLLEIFDRSIGLGAGLLLNLAPDRHGLIPAADAARVRSAAAAIRRRFAHPHRGSVTPIGEGRYEVRFARPVRIDRLSLGEELARGQRITGHSVLAGDRLVVHGRTIGVRRIHEIPAMRTDLLEVQLQGEQPVLRSCTVYEGTGCAAAVTR